MNTVCLDGKFFSSNDPVLMSTNHAFHYGDALFETMKMRFGKISLEKYHFKRLFNGIEVLKFQLPSSFSVEKISKDIDELSKRNKCEEMARIRLTVFRGNGDMNEYSANLQYLVECTPLEESFDNLNDEGLVVDIFPDVRKSCDKFSNLKSSSRIPYVMASLYAKEKGLNDSFVLNTSGNICDSTIANIFWVKDGTIFTVPLSEGCIAGVMREYLIGKLKATDCKVYEKPLSVTELENADEVFLTNAIRGIRWVASFRGINYGSEKAKELHNRFIKTINE